MINRLTYKLTQMNTNSRSNSINFSAVLLRLNVFVPQQQKYGFKQFFFLYLMFFN